MAAPAIPDYALIAKQVVRLTEIRRPLRFTDHSLVHSPTFTADQARFYAITGLLATLIEPKRADFVTEKLLTTLQPVLAQLPDAEKPAKAVVHLEMVVTKFLKNEFGK